SKPPFGYDLSAGVECEVLRRLDLLDTAVASIGIDGRLNNAFQAIFQETVKVGSVDFKILAVLTKFLADTLRLYDLVSVAHMPLETDTKNPSQTAQTERAKWFAQNLKLISVPSSLIDITQMQERLMWLNFLQRGFPISFSTAFKKLGIDNWGESPGATEFEK